MSDLTSATSERSPTTSDRTEFEVGFGRELGAHLAQELEDEAGGLFGRGASLAVSSTAVSGSTGPGS